MNNTVIVKQWATVGNGVTIKYQIIHAVNLINLIESSLAPPVHQELNTGDLVFEENSHI